MSSLSLRRVFLASFGLVASVTLGFSGVAAQASATVSYVSLEQRATPRVLITTEDYVFTGNILGTISRIDRHTNAVTTIPMSQVGEYPTYLAHDDTFLYATTNTGNIERIHMATFAIDGAPTNTGLSWGIYGIAVSSNKIYLTDYANKKLYSCTLTWPTTCTIVATLSMTNGSFGPYGPTYLKTVGSTLYIASGSGGFWIYDTATDQVVHQILLPGAYPSVDFFDVAEDKIYVADTSQNNLSVLDATTGNVIVSRPTPVSTLQPGGIAYGGGFVYMSHWADPANTIYQLDPATLLPTANWVLSANTAPRSLNFREGTLYAGSSYDSGANLNTPSRVTVIAGLPGTPVITPPAAPLSSTAATEATLAQTGLSPVTLIVGLTALIAGAGVLGLQRSRMSSVKPARTFL